MSLWVGDDPQHSLRIQQDGVAEEGHLGLNLNLMLRLTPKLVTDPHIARLLKIRSNAESLMRVASLSVCINQTRLISRTHPKPRRADEYRGCGGAIRMRDDDISALQRYISIEI